MRDLFSCNFKAAFEMKKVKGKEDELVLSYFRVISSK